jgi:predicted ATP-grasp superfamily ATP-dependent carboligase
VTIRTASILAAALMFATASFAQRPPENVSPRRHPNLAAAQRLVEQAFNRITEAQRANEWDLAGHAEKAKRLLDEANEELKRAAEAANRR